MNQYGKTFMFANQLAHVLQVAVFIRVRPTIRLTACALLIIIILIVVDNRDRFSLARSLDFSVLLSTRGLLALGIHILVLFVIFLRNCGVIVIVAHIVLFLFLFVVIVFGLCGLGLFLWCCRNVRGCLDRRTGQRAYEAHQHRSRLRRSLSLRIRRIWV
jgi:hypothetical protein